ncbi:hypothetical protein KQI63_15705 [bacterium]|nr:hypothetical protein [bacterium]
MKPNNEGFGAGPFLSMANSKEDGFTEHDLQVLATACCLSGNNEVSKGTAGQAVFGAVRWVSSGCHEGTDRPLMTSVQADGLVRFGYTEPVPVVDGFIETAGDGLVCRSRGIPMHPGVLFHGRVIAVDPAEKKCDVWLG